MAVFGVLLAIIFILGCIFAPIFAWFYVMYSICDHSAEQFEAVGQNKWVWLGLNLVFGPIGSGLYLVIARPVLKRARRTGVNVRPMQPVTYQPEILPYPTGDNPGAFGKGANEYFPEFDRDVA